MLNRFEKQLLEIAYETFVSEKHVFDVIGQKKFTGIAGIEYFIQTKLIVALEDRGFSVVLKGKQARDADIIVKDIGVELRESIATPNPKQWLLKVFEQHPKADLYMLFSKADVKNVLFAYFEENGYIWEYKQLNTQWMVWIVKKT